MVAALHGQDEIVRFFLTCDLSGEQLKLRGAIFIGSQKRIKGVSALYCACYREHFHVAKTLIEVGKANANEDSSDYSGYPLLLHATINNRLDIVRFLLENRYADVNETKSLDQREFTALICAARDGHISLVQYLLDAGADVNYCSPMEHLESRTALMFAVEKDHLDIFVLLYRRGATIDPSLFSMAIRNKSYSLLRFLLDESLITPDQLELAVASLSWSTQIEYMQTQVKFLGISLQYRQRTGQRKVCPTPLSIFDHQQECQTVDELERIADDRDRILIQLALIQYRLQSPDQRPARIELLDDYSLMLVEKKRFATCLDLCHHLFDLDEQFDGDSSLHRFIWLFCEILSSDDHLYVDRFLPVAYLIFRPFNQKHLERSLNNALFMVILATKVVFSHPLVCLSMITLWF